MSQRRKRHLHPRIIGGLLAAALAALALGVVAHSASGSGTAPSPLTSSPSASPSPATFQGSIERITPTEKRWMTGETWHRGCPVPIRSLRLLRMDYFNFDGDVVQGRMVVNRRAASDMLGVLETMFNGEFPLEHVDTLELYPPAERPDKLRNVSVAFNCRVIAGSSTWSQHAYGLAVDINPVQNPWVSDGKVIPRVGRAYVDRTQHLPGMIHRNDAVVAAFSDIGWGWGGNWRTLKDYMHFSRTGG